MRDNFTTATIETIAKRAGQCCSNPSCNIPTSGPHSDPTKSINIGVAAHISAASPGGKRYNRHLTSEQRSSILNAIWLCENCAKLIDTDTCHFPEELLHDWKRRHEGKIFFQISGHETFKQSLLDSFLSSDLKIIPSGDGKSAIALFSLKNRSLIKVNLRKLKVHVIEFFGMIPMGSFVHSSIATIDLSDSIKFGKQKQISLFRVIEPNEEDLFSIAFTAPKLNGIRCSWKINISIETNIGTIDFIDKEIHFPIEKESYEDVSIDQLKLSFRDICLENLKDMSTSSLSTKIYAYYYIFRKFILPNIFHFNGYTLFLRGHLYYSGPSNFLKNLTQR